MTDLRTAAQQALEALKSCSGVPHWPALQPTIHALRAALAQQAEAVEPVAWSGYDLDGMVEAFSRVIEAHHSSKHPFQNPIDMDAWMALRILRGFIPAMKAYAALAQQAEPLTVERLRDALVASRIIPPAAVEDPEGYDDGVTLFRIEALHRRIT